MKKLNKASEKYLKDKDNIKVQNFTFSECSLRFLSQKVMNFFHLIK